MTAVILVVIVALTLIGLTPTIRSWRNESRQKQLGYRRTPRG